MIVLSSFKPSHGNFATGQTQYISNICMQNTTQLNTSLTKSKVLLCTNTAVLALSKFKSLSILEMVLLLSLVTCDMSGRIYEIDQLQMTQHNFGSNISVLYYTCLVLSFFFDPINVDKMLLLCQSFMYSHPHYHLCQ